MKRICISAFFLFTLKVTVFCQQSINQGNMIFFHGLVADAVTLTPLAGSHIKINSNSLFVSESDGTFSFYVTRNDTVVFSRMGYKSTQLFISDTLAGREYLAGVFLNPDTISIGEVIIIPRLANLKNELLNTRTMTKTEMENAKFNVAVSAYIGRNSTGSLGDPVNNYEVLRQKQRINAFEKGGISSDKMLGLNPFILIPAAYLLMHGLPEKAEPLKPQLTDKELDQINRKYLETLRKK